MKNVKWINSKSLNKYYVTYKIIQKIHAIFTRETIAASLQPSTGEIESVMSS